MRAIALALLAILGGCAGLPDGVARSPSSALTDTAGTRLGRGLAAAIAANPGKSGRQLGC